MKLRSTILLMSAVLALLANSLPVYAGFITDHATTSVYGEAGSLGGLGGVDAGSSFDEGEYASSSTDSFSSDNGESYGSATSSLIDGFFSLASSATASVATVEGDTARRWGYASAQAQWYDIINLETMNTDILGNTLRINFYVEGSVEIGGGASAGATKGAFTNKTVWLYTDDNATPDAISESFVSLGYFDGLTTGGWNGGLTMEGGAYTGRFSVDVPIDEGGWTYGGLGGGLGIRMFATSTAGVDTGGDPSLTFGYARAYDPMFFESITLPDKGNVTPESLGVSLSFDSGMQSPNRTSSVPEPGSLAIFLTGLPAMAFALARRRKQKVVCD